MQTYTHIGEIMKKIVPPDIIKALQKLHDKKDLLEEEKTKLDTWLCSLETAVVNPVCRSKILVNPIPKEPDVSLAPERNLEERIKHINTISARVASMMRPETEDEAGDFDVDDDFDMGAPKSIFEVKDHFVDMVPDHLPPLSKKVVPNPDLMSEADISASHDTEDPEGEGV